MGFYIRKSFGVGPFRLNLSKSGLGVSAGVKGARVGLTPGGRSYVHCGRGGIYYRSYLDGHDGVSRSRSQSTGNRSRATVVERDDTVGPEREIESGDVSLMVDSSATALLEEINLRLRSPRLHRWLLGSGAVGGAVLAGASLWGGAVALPALAAAATPFAAIRDRRRKTMELVYDLEPDYDGVYQQLMAAFERAASTERAWVVETAADVYDRKYHAGASEVVGRTEVRLRRQLPAYLKCAIVPPMIPAGKQSLYLLPDTILVYERGRVGAVGYRELRVEFGTTRFIESGRRPRDAEQVDRTWRYVNKRGGPDRRFKDNPELPVMEYGVLRCRSASGLHEEFQLSNAAAAMRLGRALDSMADVAVRAG